MAGSTQGAANNAASATWQPLGPTAVITPDFGLVTGRISAIALDPSDATGNHLYIGTTGGGVWSSSNAGTSTVSNIVFNPLTDALTALGGFADASISIGALTVQPGDTGVILAGTGDPNDVLDSYYGAGILRSTDGGNSWTLIHATSDSEDNLSTRDVDFAGEGFAGFAWSTANPQLVVAAVSQSYEGDVVDANLPALNCEGLYYSSDSGATWPLATITDGNGAVVQSPGNPLRRAQRQRGHVRGLEPCATAVHRRRPLSRLLPVRRRHHLDAHGRQPGAGSPRCFAPPTPASRLHGLPHLSRRAGRQSPNRRHLCLDRRYR